MPSKKTTKTVTADTASLLQEGEGDRADFKRGPDGVSAEDLVAFANAGGGAILAGVDERTGDGGAQVGIVVGCDVGDGTILQIANKALGCIPPVAINVSIESDDGTSFLRIDVPSSATKPHYTPKGIYCTRDGRRIRALHPTELLKIFLESEARAFAERFEAAAGRMTKELRQLESSLDASIQSMADQLGWADSKLGDTEGALGTIQAYVTRINSETNDVASRLRTIFRQDKRDDPVTERERTKLRDELVDQLLDDRKLLDSIAKGTANFTISAKGKAAEELTKEDLQSIFEDALKIVVDKVEKEKYSVQIKKPGDFTENELNDFAVLVKKGGEVADGIEARLKTADVLGFIRYDKAIVGVGALKKPAAAYRNGVFQKAQATANPGDFTRWLFVEQKHRGKQTRDLIAGLLDAARAKLVYATTRKANEKLQRILKHHRFFQNGAAYPSTENPGEEIILLTQSSRPSISKEKEGTSRPQ
ncbi:ATP-binding protein [Mesorhizobium sp. BR1-1-3]|uniref:AlbA family DNA-binding domain-containing protein n=1 Tax=Mesorhizobium sp. BR1-1-3 TaxID=2876651 RepID=UPI001CD10A08|nr:ATP-binding protein [Mesorhizobium sp. BR1-1-3]MBZ9887311.1 ATP-binding protein [Mesorhizobium sp. BR1-1-3]